MTGNKASFRGQKDFPGDSVVKNSPANAGGEDSNPDLRRSPGKGMATHFNILPGKSHRQRGQRSLMDWSPWDHKESGMT